MQKNRALVIIRVRVTRKVRVISKLRLQVRINYVHIFEYSPCLPLFKMNKTKINVTISKVLNYKPMVVWSGWKNVNSLDNTLNKTEFKMPSLYFLKFNVTSDLVSRPLGEGFNDCHPKCCVFNTDGEKSMHFSKEEAGSLLSLNDNRIILRAPILPCGSDMKYLLCGPPVSRHE